jgi:hypothetical protein
MEGSLRLFLEECNSIQVNLCFSPMSFQAPIIQLGCASYERYSELRLFHKFFPHVLP